MKPIRLGPNQPATFYHGSGRIAAFRGIDAEPRPEDWVGSATARFAAAPAGITGLPDGTRLDEAIAADPRDWLGAEHAARFGASPALLVKLLDAGQRLPLHVHPDRRFATTHLGSPFGKTEAWIVLEAPAGAVVHLGFARDVGADELSRWVGEQDVAALLGATNQVPVAAGDAVLCPAGTPHAIGDGIFLVELQEPTDFSVLLEWDGFGLSAGDATLGLPMELALECVDRTRVTPERLAALRGVPNAVGSLLPAEADSFFVAQRLRGGPIEASFAVLVVTAGSGRMFGGWGEALPLEVGQTWLVPFGAGPVEIEGDLTVIRCRPS